MIHHRFTLFVFWTLLTLSLAACQTAASPQWQWERAEAGLPRQALILTLAFDPANPDRLWAGTYASDGLAFSEDGGQTWTTSAAGLNGNPVFDLLALPPVDGASGGMLWAATRTGLMQSLDAGASWQPAPGELPAVTAFALASDAGGRLYVGLDAAGIFAQTKDGAGWEALAAPPSPPEEGVALRSGPAGEQFSLSFASTRDEPLPVTHFEKNPPSQTPLERADQGAAERLATAAVLSLGVAPDGRHIYAGTAGRGLFASQDGGRSWINTYPDDFAPNLAVNPTQPAQAIASLRDRLVRTGDGGRTWHTLPVPWAGDEIASLLWLADGTLGAGTGRGRLYRSLDGGETWVEGGAGLSASGSVLTLAAVGDLQANASGRFLAGTWTGLYASDDGGQSWANLAPSLGTPKAHALLATEQGLLLGTEAGLFRWQPDAGRWMPLAVEASLGSVTSLAMAPSQPQLLYAGTGDDGVYRSDDGGSNWQRLPSLGVGVPALAVDPTDPDHVYMLAIFERIYESGDGGQKWQARWDGLGVLKEAASLAIDPVEPTVYLGADTGLFRSRSGADWQPAAPALADQSVLALLAQPIPATSGGGSVLYIGATRGVYRSLNGGRSVQQGASGLGWGRGLEDLSVTAFLADPEKPGRLYAGTAYAGVYQSTDWGQSWQPIGPAGLDRDVIEALAWGPAGELFVAAAGGVWKGVVR